MGKWSVFRRIEQAITMDILQKITMRLTKYIIEKLAITRVFVGLSVLINLIAHNQLLAVIKKDYGKQNESS